VPEGEIEVVPLVGHPAQGHIGEPRGGPRGPAGRPGDLQGLLAGPDGRIQTALAALDLGERISAPGGVGGQAGRLPSGDAGREGILGLRQPSA
jgi:hypothetical protein